MKLGKHLLLTLFLGITFISFSQEKIDLLILNRNYTEALSEIDKKLEKRPSANLFLKKGLICQNLQNYQKALFAFSNGLQYNQGSFDLNSEMAESLALLGNSHDAINFYKKAVNIQPDNLSVTGKLGKTYINLKKYKQAYEVFSGIYAVDSTNVYWNKQLAFSAFKSGKREEAIGLYEKVLEQNSRDHSSYINLSHLYNRKKNPEKVHALLFRGLAEFPNDAELYLEVARFFFGTKQYEEAVKAYEDYFGAGGLREMKIQLNYAISCYFAKDEQKSMDALTECSAAAPNDPFVLFYKSLNHKRLSQYEDAEKFMIYAIEASFPDFLPKMYHHLGQIHGAQREFEESVAALKKSIELDPTNHEIIFEIATTYEEFNSNKTLALNYYQLYLREVSEGGKNVNYALDRITKIKEDLFFEE